MTCLDCGAETQGSARCPECWNDKCGNQSVNNTEVDKPAQKNNSDVGNQASKVRESSHTGSDYTNEEIIERVERANSELSGNPGGLAVGGNVADKMDNFRRCNICNLVISPSEWGGHLDQHAMNQNHANEAESLYKISSIQQFYNESCHKYTPKIITGVEREAEAPLDQVAREIIIKHALWDAGFCGEQSAERGPVMLKVFELVESAIKEGHQSAEAKAAAAAIFTGTEPDLNHGRDAVAVGACADITSHEPVDSLEYKSLIEFMRNNPDAEKSEFFLGGFASAEAKARERVLQLVDALSYLLKDVENASGIPSEVIGFARNVLGRVSNE